MQGKWIGMLAARAAHLPVSCVAPAVAPAAAFITWYRAARQARVCNMHLHSNAQPKSTLCAAQAWLHVWLQLHSTPLNMIN
jgi:hypothetical protein